MLNLETIVAELVREYSPELVRDIAGVAETKSLDVASYMVQYWCIVNDSRLYAFANSRNCVRECIVIERYLSDVVWTEVVSVLCGVES